MEQRQILLGILVLAILYFIFIHNTEKMENVTTPMVTPPVPQPINTPVSQATEAVQMLASTAMAPAAASPSEVIPIANAAIAPMTSQSGVAAVQVLAQQALSPVPAPQSQVQQAVTTAINSMPVQINNSTKLAELEKFFSPEEKQQFFTQYGMFNSSTTIADMYSFMTPEQVQGFIKMINDIQNKMQTQGQMQPVQNALPSVPPVSMPTPQIVQSIPIVPAPAPTQNGTTSPASIIEAFTQASPAAPAEDKPQTIFGVRNAFTGLRCYDENLPIVSVDSNTFTCISRDGQKCLTRDELLIPKTTEVVNGRLVQSTILCRNRDNRTVTTWVSGTPYNIGDTVTYQGVSYLVINNIPADKTTIAPTHRDASRFWKKADDVNTYLSKDGIRQLPGPATKPNTRNIFNDLDSNGYYTMECTLNGLNDPNHWCSQVYGSVDKMCNSFVNPDGTPDQFTKASVPECSGTLQTFRDSWKNLTPAEIPAPPPTKSTLWKRPPANAAPAPGAAPGAFEIASCKNKTCLRNRPRGMDLKTCQSNCDKCGKPSC
jgi:hypothetical protein